MPIPHTPFSTHPAEIVLRNRDGSPAFVAPHWPLPCDKARFVGEAVAMVVATTVAAAKDGAELIAIDYEPLPAVTEATAATASGAPRIWDDAASNLCIDAVVGDLARTEAAFASAACVVGKCRRRRNASGRRSNPVHPVSRDSGRSGHSRAILSAATRRAIGCGETGVYEGLGNGHGG